MNLDYYQILGVSPSADLDTIKKAFRQKVMECHPDRGGSHAQMILINEAWEILSNPEFRQHHDSFRNQAGGFAGQKIVEADAQIARQRAGSYPHQWKDVEPWLNNILKDFVNTKYGSSNLYGVPYGSYYSFPTAGDSISGWLFILIGAALVVFGGVYFMDNHVWGKDLSSWISGNGKYFKHPIIIIPLLLAPLWVGACDGDSEARPDELPCRTITFTKPFQMGVYEVTVAQFLEFVEAQKYKTLAESSGLGGWKASTASSWGIKNSDLNWSSPGYPVAADLPVTMVSYEDALAFCAWLSKRDGKNYRLPTEAEWEYACRAGSKDVYHFPIKSRDSYCWSLWNTKGTVSPRPVGTRQPNPLGLFDMEGNAREWCLDWYGEKAYLLSQKEFPRGPLNGTLRVIRGGCFIDMNSFLRSSHRGYLAPDQVLNNQGFRVVAEGK